MRASISYTLLTQIFFDEIIVKKSRKIQKTRIDERNRLVQLLLIKLIALRSYVQNLFASYAGRQGKYQWIADKAGELLSR